METMINLNDLLKHEILDLYSAEEQIIEALPAMIEKAKNPELKKALREHLKVTEEQKSRLDKVKQTFGEGNGQNGEDGEKKGFFSRLFSGGSGGEKCKGMEGLITEGEKIMSADITDEALDAAIIASAQKIEHYEICGYGTARAFARELQLAEVERLLTQTLNEEYKADDLLTELAVGKLNVEAEKANGMENGKTGRANRTGDRNNNSSKAARKSSGSKTSSSGGNNKSSGSKSASKAGASKANSKSSAGKGNATKSGAKKSAGSAAKNSGKSSSSRNSKSGGNKSASKNKNSKSGRSRGR